MDGADGEGDAEDDERNAGVARLQRGKEIQGDDGEADKSEDEGGHGGGGGDDEDQSEDGEDEEEDSEQRFAVFEGQRGGEDEHRRAREEGFAGDEVFDDRSHVLGGSFSKSEELKDEIGALPPETVEGILVNNEHPKGRGNFATLITGPGNTIRRSFAQ